TVTCTGRRIGYSRGAPRMCRARCRRLGGILMTAGAQQDHRMPTPDRAEDNAYFPSPYSLGQYTAAKTDFDGLATQRNAYTGGRWKVLVIASDERYLLMGNETLFSTGNHPVETL